MGWILRFLLLIVVIWVIWRFLGGIIEGLSPEPARGKRSKAASVPLVRDPVCGTYVVRTRAIAVGTGSETQYFCSEKCRDEYARRR
jgi:uncharacterized protein